MKLSAGLSVLLAAIMLSACEMSRPCVKEHIIDPGGNVTLYVSNQSFDNPKVDIQVSIDDEIHISDRLHVRNQHHRHKYLLQLSEGTHRLEAVSADGGASLKTEFEVNAEHHWGVLSFWTDRAEEEKAHFTFTVQDEPVQFL